MWSELVLDFKTSGPPGGLTLRWLRITKTWKYTLITNRTGLTMQKEPELTLPTDSSMYLSSNVLRHHSESS